jgi:hypothetical protein
VLPDGKIWACARDADVGKIRPCWSRTAEDAVSTWTVVASALCLGGQVVTAAIYGAVLDSALNGSGGNDFE